MCLSCTPLPVVIFYHIAFSCFLLLGSILSSLDRTPPLIVLPIHLLLALSILSLILIPSAGSFCCSGRMVKIPLPNELSHYDRIGLPPTNRSNRLVGGLRTSSGTLVLPD